MTAKTITAAIAAANEKVGRLHKITPDGWGYNEWSEKHKAWWVPHPQPYATAQSYRTRRIVFYALCAMGWNPDDASDEAETDRAGRARDRIAAAIKAGGPR